MKKDILINNINMFIKAKGIKQNWIADMLDMNKMTISNILNSNCKKVDLNDYFSVLIQLYKFYRLLHAHFSF